MPARLQFAAEQLVAAALADGVGELDRPLHPQTEPGRACTQAVLRVDMVHGQGFVERPQLLQGWRPPDRQRVDDEGHPLRAVELARQVTQRPALQLDVAPAQAGGAVAVRGRDGGNVGALQQRRGFGVVQQTRQGRDVGVLVDKHDVRGARGCAQLQGGQCPVVGAGQATAVAVPDDLADGRPWPGGGCLVVVIDHHHAPHGLAQGLHRTFHVRRLTPHHQHGGHAGVGTGREGCAFGQGKRCGRSGTGPPVPARSTGG